MTKKKRKKVKFLQIFTTYFYNFSKKKKKISHVTPKVLDIKI